MATPLIRALKQTYPDTNLDLLTEPVPAQVLENNPHIREIIIAPFRGAPATSYLPLVRQLRKRRYNVALDLLSTPGSALLTRLSGAAVRIGYDLRGRRWAYTIPIQRSGDVIYNPLTKFQLASPLQVTGNSPLPELFVDDASERWADARLSELGIDPATGIMTAAVAPWSRRSWRRWTDAGWLGVMQSMGRGRQVIWLLFATEGERPHLAGIEKTGPNKVLWAGADHLLKAAALLKRCRMLLCAENGVKHLAVAAGVPTFTVYVDYPGVKPQVWTPPEHPLHTDVIARQDCSDAAPVAEKACEHWLALGGDNA